MNSTKLLCKHFGVCGGCEFQDIDYSQQIKNKQQLLLSLFKDFKTEKVQEIIPSCDVLYYRNKMEFAVGRNESGKVAIGLRERKKFYRIVDLSECKISFDKVGELLCVVKDWIKENNIEPYDLIEHKGKFRYVVIRHAKNTDEMLINFVITGTKYQFEQYEQKLFLNLAFEFEKFKNVKSIYVSINNKISDDAKAESLINIYKEDSIQEVLNDIKYKIYPTTFFQPNSRTAEVLYKVVIDEILEGNVLDIYCGSGGITLQVFKNKNVDKIIGVDSSLDNIKIAQENIKLNSFSLEKIEFVCEEAEVFLAKLWKSKFISNLSTVIVDPPRPGLSKKVKAILNDIGANRIIYVSCNPSTLKEDLKIFLKFYKIKKLIPIDMFPHTRHIEVVCVLEHK